MKAMKQKKQDRGKVAGLPVVGFDPANPKCVECGAEIGQQSFLMGRMKHQDTGQNAYAPICINCAVAIIAPILAPSIVDTMFRTAHPPFPHDHDGDGNPIVEGEGDPAIDPRIKH